MTPSLTKLTAYQLGLCRNAPGKKINEQLGASPARVGSSAGSTGRIQLCSKRQKVAEHTFKSLGSWRRGLCNVTLQVFVHAKTFPWKWLLHISKGFQCCCCTLQHNILFPGFVRSTLHLHYTLYTSVSKDWRQPGSERNKMTGQGYTENKGYSQD